MAEFSFDPQGNRSGRRKLIYASLFFMAVLMLDAFSGGSVRTLLQGSIASVWTVSGNMRAAVADSGVFTSKNALAKENAALRERLDMYTQQAVAYESVRQENEVLRALLNLSEGSEGITAPIVSSVRSSPYGTFLVRASADDGVVPGSVVMTRGGFAFGIVSDIRGNTTVVTEVFAGGEKIDAHIGGSIASVRGRGGGNAIAEIPRGVEVKVGDTVTAPLLGGKPIGVVGKIEADTSSASQTVYIHLPVNISSLRYVYIIPAL